MSLDASRYSGATRLAEDTRRRFLAEILARVPLDRLVEVHLFTPIRQGGVETGVAVVAARRDEEVAADAAAAHVAGQAAAVLADVAPAEIAIADAPSDAPQADPTERAAEPPAAGEPGAPNDAPPGDDAPDGAPDGALRVGEVADEAAPADGGSPADGPGDLASADTPLDVENLDEALADDEFTEDVPATPTVPPPRLTVLTARYRLTVKGPDRGRWDADVVAEADAPLVTVEAVVRGVQRRAGDAVSAERLAADAVAREVGVPAPAP